MALVEVIVRATPADGRKRTIAVLTEEQLSLSAGRIGDVVGIAVTNAALSALGIPYSGLNRRDGLRVTTVRHGEVEVFDRATFAGLYTVVEQKQLNNYAVFEVGNTSYNVQLKNIVKVEQR